MNFFLLVPIGWSATRQLPFGKQRFPWRNLIESRGGIKIYPKLRQAAMKTALKEAQPIRKKVRKSFPKFAVYSA